VPSLGGHIREHSHGEESGDNQVELSAWLTVEDSPHASCNRLRYGPGDGIDLRSGVRGEGGGFPSEALQFPLADLFKSLVKRSADGTHAGSQSQMGCPSGRAAF
jgi:hypothetical protein